MALSRSASVLIPASEDKSDRQRKLLHTQPVPMESIHPREVQRVGQGEDIDVSRSQSQPSLFHTMSADCSATVVSIGAMSKASKISKSSKSKRKERRASVSEMSTVATTAAIEAVTQAMQACGGDVAKAALLLMQQQPVIKDGTKRRSKKKEDKSDDVSLSVSVLSDDTSRSGKAHRGSKKKKSPSKDIGAGNVQDKFDDCERSLRSSSTRGSRSSLRNARRSGSSSSVDDDDFLRESFSRGKSDRGSSLMPIEEEVVIRGGSRTSYHSNGRSGRRRGQNGESVGDDVDSDGELIGPPTIFCFWNKPVSKTALQPQSRVVPPALVSKSKASCLVM